MSTLQVSVKDYATMKCYAIDADETISSAAKKMNDLNIGALIVDKNHDGIYTEREDGIFTERDFLKAWVSNPSGIKDLKVGDFCSSPMITIHQSASLGKATQLMLTEKIRRLPVVDDTGKAIGFCSIKDILKATHNTFLAILNS